MNGIKYGEALRAIRQHHDVTISQLSVELDFSKSYISEIESGRKNVTLAVVQRYAERFRLNPSCVMELAENMSGIKTTPKQRSRRAEILERYDVFESLMAMQLGE